MNIVQKTVSSLGIILVPVLVTRAVASPKPTLPQVVENTYLAPYQQTRTTTLQTVTYGYTTSTISGTSVTDSAVVNSKFTQVVDMTTTVYGSMSRQKVYVANGVTYFNTGRGWTGGTKNPDAGDWAKTVTRMSTVWKPIYVSNAPGAREFRANDTENSGHKILDSLITQVLLRNHLHLEKSYSGFDSWLVSHFLEATVIRTEASAGKERIKQLVTTLTIHLTSAEVKKFWGTNSSTASGGGSAQKSQSTFYPLTAKYQFISSFTYQPIQIPVPQGLPTGK